MSFLSLVSMVVNPMKFSFITGYFNIFALKALDKLTIQWGDFNSFFLVLSNYITLILTVLFAVGTLVYIKSDYKNFRILRFIYSVLLFKIIISFPLTLVHFYSYYFGLETTFYGGYNQFQPKEFGVLDLLQSSLSIAFIIFYVVASFKIVKYFNSQMQLKSDTEDYEYYKRTYFFETKKANRFLHMLVDNVFLYSLFYSLIMTAVQFRFASDFFESIDAVLGEKGSLLLVTSVFRIIYFVFYECQFRATPGKFLTQTRVMNYDGAEATTGNIISRTFSRLVPLESITFLLGYNLHDNWSSTAVYDEIAVDEQNPADTKDNS